MSFSRFVLPSRTLVAGALALAFILPAAARAQAQPRESSLAAPAAQISNPSPVSSENAAVKATPSTSVMFTAAPAALTVPKDSLTPSAPLRKQDGGDNRRTNTTLILVGAAAIIIGAAVGDDAGTILIVGGAGIGLFGLYRLLN